MDTTVDNIKINVESNTGDAETSLRNIETILKRINKVYGDGTNTTKKADKEVKKTASSISVLGNEIKKSKVSTFLNSLGRIATYRLVRTAISSITNGLKEGIGNVYQYSKAIKGQFADSLDRATSSLNYMKNALGAMVAPIINMVVPWLEKATDKLVDFFNVLNEAFAYMGGQSTWTKAIKTTKAYADANKELKASLLGIDELNVLNGGSGTDNNSSYAFKEMLVNEKEASATLGWLEAILGVVVSIKAATTGIKLGKSLISAGISAASLAKLGAFGAAVAGGLVLGILVKAEIDKRSSRMLKDFFDVQGTSIADVQEMLDKYLASFDFDKMGEFVQKIKDAEKAFRDAHTEYDLMWAKISTREKIDTTDIDNLSSAFENLVEATRNLANARIDSVLQNIKTGIEMNIGAELTGRLTELSSKLISLQYAVNGDLTGLNSRYQEILTEVTANGGVITDANRKEMQKLTEQLAKYSASGDTAYAEWQRSSGKINIGSTESDAKAAIEALATARDTYLESLSAKQKEDELSIYQAALLDERAYGGAMGISANRDQYLKDLEASYSAQRAFINSEYNSVLQKMYDTYAANAKELGYAGLSHTEKIDAAARNAELSWTDPLGVGSFFNNLMELDARQAAGLAEAEILEQIKSAVVDGVIEGFSHTEISLDGDEITSSVSRRKTDINRALGGSTHGGF